MAQQRTVVLSRVSYKFKVQEDVQKAMDDLLQKYPGIVIDHLSHSHAVYRDGNDDILETVIVIVIYHLEET